jgi:hypothetical protein
MGEVGIEITPIIDSPSLESRFAAQLDALLRRTCQIARALTSAEQAALKLWVGEDSSQARKYFSLSENYAAFRDFRVDPKGTERQERWARVRRVRQDEHPRARRSDRRDVGRATTGRAAAGVVGGTCLQCTTITRSPCAECRQAAPGSTGRQDDDDS